MPSHRHCLVPDCSNRRDSCKFGLFSGDDGVYAKARLCGSMPTDNRRARQGCGGKSDVCKSVTFQRLPVDKYLRKRWLAAIPCVNVPMTRNSYVCGQHFVGGGRQGIDAIPTILAGRKTVHLRKSFASTGRLDRFSELSSPTSGEEMSDDEESVLFASACPPEVAASVSKAFEEMSLQEQVCHLQKRLEDSERKVAEYKAAMEEAQARLNFGFDYASQDEKVFKFYTGLRLEENMDYSGIARSTHEGRDSSHGSGRKMSKENELFMTLCKLRHNFPESDLVARFNISQSTLSRVFRTWMLCLAYTFEEMDIWPSREHVNKFMPKVFQDAYPTTRVIIDATEFPIEKPANPDVQASTCSGYKHRNMFKVLVGCSPNGALTFFSNVYGGRITNKEITKQSGIIRKLEKGDSMMADCEFNVDDLLPEGLQCNVPPFLGNRDQLEPAEVLSTHRIAILRIHVERAIERIKNCRITSMIPVSMCPLGHQIISACAFLSLFDDPLLPPAK